MAKVDWDEALAVHRSAVVVDGCSFFCHGYNARLEKAGVTALQMTVPWTTDDAKTAIGRYGEYYQLFKRDERVALVQSVDDVRRYKAEGKVGMIFGSQNARMLEEEIANIEIFHRLGVRVIQLTYNERNFIGDGCLETSNAGLSRFGRAVIAEMNRIGMTIDLTHVGERTTLEAMDRSEQPCIFSHSNPRRRADNPRNVTDEQIRRCAERGGVVGVTPWPPISWTGSSEPPTLADLIGHIEYLVDLVGSDHVSIGTDSEATPGAYPQALKTALITNYGDIQAPYRAAFPHYPPTQGFESMEDLPQLTYALLNRGWSELDVRKLLGDNLMRIYAATWR